MAPKKKNKKPSANSSRGFATTSVASKSKVESTIQDTPPDHPDKLSPNGSHGASTGKPTESQRGSKDLSELTPEELEAKLEESELQLFVEKYRPKVTKDATRTITRHLTERRLLRGQAESLPISRWLPDEVIETIANHMRQRMHTVTATAQPPAQGSFAYEDLVSKLWVLKQSLEGLGFVVDQCNDATGQLLRDPLLIDQAKTDEARDGLWGFSVCLDILGTVLRNAELPSYDSQSTTKKSQVLNGFDKSAPGFSETASIASSASGTATPLTTESELGPSKANGRNNGPVTDKAADTDSTESESEDDEDLEPRLRIDRYIKLKSKLHKRRPELTEVAAPNKKSSKLKHAISANQLDSKSARIVARLKRFESDMLFDQNAALRRWGDVRLQLVRDEAEWKKLQLNEDATVSKSEIVTSLTIGQPTELAESEEDGMELGDFFATLPDEQIDNTGKNTLTTTNAEGQTVIIRDFGKWSGINPRRILEETCRARDASSKVVYSLISESAFSIRYTIKILWSKSQDLPDETVLPGFICRADTRNMFLEMTGTSAPDKLQSESFASVAALFLVFSPSVREEKAHLRLPVVWRDVWTDFLAIRQERLDHLDRAKVQEIRNLIERNCATDSGKEPKKVLEGNNHKVYEEDKPGDEASKYDLSLDPAAAKSLWVSKSSSPAYKNMLRSRQQLPMWSYKGELLEAVDKNQVVIVCGETGCGKSTQVPSFLLENELSQGRDCKIYCTEPRRVSAISLARRVSEELGERKHDVGTIRSLVGYAIRLESRTSHTTKLVYATTGIVMRMLENTEGFEQVTHIVLDEVHERTIDSDFLLIVLRKLMVQRPSLKVILMSATVNAEEFSRYLNNAPIFDVPGRTFPVEVKFLEDAVESMGKYLNLQSANLHVLDDQYSDEADLDDARQMSLSTDLDHYSTQTRKFLSQFNEYRIDYGLVVKLLEIIASRGEFVDYSKAILVFLPGLAEIRRLNDILVGHVMFSRRWQIFPLHSTIATESQEAAFHIPPPGVRKIVLATNIAETGITIPDITCVVDLGKHREMRFDEKRQLSRLIECFISKANAKQRRGRAGRVQNGLCFHLFTKARHDRVLADHQTPEMLRLSLQDLSLRVKICKLGGIEEVLLQALNPPMPKNIRRAVDSLIEVKALTDSEELTSLGRQLAKLPLDVYLGKLILLSSIFKCLDAGLTIAAILTSKSPFSSPFGSRDQADQARLAYKRGDSDLLTVYNAYYSWRRVCQTNPPSEYQFCRKNFLVPQTLANIEDLKSQLATTLVEAGFLKPDSGVSLLQRSSHQRSFVILPLSSNANGNNDLIVNSVIAWSFYPKLLTRDGRTYRNVANNQNVSLHPTSVNRGVPAPPKWLSYYSIMQSNSKFYNALETSSVEDFAVALVCGEAEFKTYAGTLTLDGNRVRFSVSSWTHMLAVKTLRTRLKEIIAQALRSPGRELTDEQNFWFGIWEDAFKRRDEALKRLAGV